MNYMNALMDPGAIGQGMSGAFEQGMEARRQRETMNALAGYAQNQSPEAAMAVSQHDPMIGLQLQDREDERQAAQLKAEELRYKQELQQRAAQGDPNALAELAGIDIAAWNTISDQEKQGVKERADYIGQAALRISQLPENQRPQAWDAAAQQGGMPEYVGQYSPQALDAAIAQAGLVKQFIDLTTPSIMAIQPGGGLYGVSNQGQVTPYVVPNQGAAPAFSPAQGGGNPAGIPQAAVEYLRGHPELWREFEQKYGQGTARRFLGLN